MNFNKYIGIISILMVIFGCDSEEHFITDSQQRQAVMEDLERKRGVMKEGDLFQILDEPMSLKEKEALQFLYAYMPLGDITDYPGSYYKANVEMAFRAKEEMPWGKDIPEREFNHFVMPLRINNENLDDFRTTFYEELKARVQDKTQYEAILEVNHWCHERVNYKPSDSRTSSPMATVKTSWGRCGEESTLLVCALRTVGIPARQVYTPRWAHCDDNHAWVEAYVDGGWHFLGACEPEPVLDLGWFNEPASRALLLHTRVFGRYYGPEEVIERTDNHTEINVVDNYGETAKTVFRVVDEDGQAKAGIPVEFKIYNYAEFCTVVTKKTEQDGTTWLTAGLGSMMAYASEGDQFGFEVFRPGEVDTVTIVLDHDGSGKYLYPTVEYDMVPPVAHAKTPEVTEAMKEENAKRNAADDVCRNAYIDLCEKEQQQLIAQTGSKKLGLIYGKSWGNYKTLAEFIRYAEEQDRLTDAINLLGAISDKDLRDVDVATLKDHLDYTTRNLDEFWVEYVLNPRVSNEMILPYKQVLSQTFSAEEQGTFVKSPETLVDWVKDNIVLCDEHNVRQIPMSPVGVMKSKVADRHSRDIFFVAMARSLGIPAQISPVTGKVQYLSTEGDKRAWRTVNFEVEGSKVVQAGVLDLEYEPISGLPDPKYYTHFSIKKFENGSFHLLAYDAKDPGIDDGMSLSAFDYPLVLDAGFYILTAGTRLSNGTALTHSEFFTISDGIPTTANIILREPETGVRTLGSFNAENRFVEMETHEEKSVLQVAGRSFYILGLLDQGSEPTTHAMNDISAVKQALEESGYEMLFLFEDEREYELFKLKGFNELPSNITYGVNDGQMRQELVSNLHLDHDNLPIFIIANSNNEVVFVSQGYTIGLGEQLKNILTNL